MMVYKATWSIPIGTDWICDSLEDAMKMAELIARNVLRSYSCEIIDGDDFSITYKFYLEDDTDDEEENERIRDMTEDERTEYLEIQGYELNLYPLPWNDMVDKPNIHKIDTSFWDEDNEDKNE